MKIGVFVNNLAKTTGGAGRFEAEIARALSSVESSHSFVAVSRGEDCPFFEGRHIQLWKRSPVGKWADRKRRLLRRPLPPVENPSATLRRAGVDLLYSPSPWPPDLDIPIVSTCWDLQHRIQPWFPEVSVLGWTWSDREQHYRRLLPKSTRVVVGTETGLREVNAFYSVPPSSIRVIPFPASTAMIDCEAEEPSWRPSEEFVVYPAVFWPHKNHVTVLDAIRCLSDAGVELHVVFPGGDAEGQAGTKEYVKRLAAGMGLSAKVHFPGFIPDSELRWAYENALALVYASLFGPDNLPPLEACLLGCPAIVAAIDGASDQLCDAAIFFEPLSGKDLATKIMALKKDSELRRNQIDRGKTLAIGLSVDRYIERLLTMFDELEMSFRCWSLDDVHRDLACREK